MRSATVAAQVRRHGLHDVVAFRVNGAGVQGMCAAGDAQKAGGLLKGLGAQARHLLQCFRGIGNGPLSSR